jgi:hypothetical protein
MPVGNSPRGSAHLPGAGVFDQRAIFSQGAQQLLREERIALGVAMEEIGNLRSDVAAQELRR